jgi:hypothetical protein
LWQRAICRIKENDGEIIMERFLLHVLQVVFTLVVFASPVILVGLTIYCFVEHKIILGIVLSVVFSLCLGILIYDW